MINAESKWRLLLPFLLLSHAQVTRALCLLLQAYHDYLAFLLMINEAVKGKKISDDFPVSEVCVTCTVNVSMYMHVHFTVVFYTYL